VPDRVAISPRVRALAGYGETQWLRGQECPNVCHVVPSAPTYGGAAQAHDMSGGAARHVPRSADMGVASLWCLPRGYRDTPLVRGRERPPLRRSTPQVIDATSAWKFMNVAHVAGRRGRVRGGLARRSMYDAMFMPLAFPSTLDHPAVSSWRGLEPGAHRRWGPFSLGRGLDLNHRIGQMSITFRNDVGK
jgi:hypothetical protein